MKKKRAIKIVSRLKEIREKLGLPKYKMCEKIGIADPYSYYKKLEEGKYNPSIGRAMQIAEKLDLKVTDIWSLKK